MQSCGQGFWALSEYSGRGRQSCALAPDNRVREVLKSQSQGPDITQLTHSLESHMVISDSDDTEAGDIGSFLSPCQDEQNQAPKSLISQEITS